jgi:hypothetical protein
MAQPAPAILHTPKPWRSSPPSAGHGRSSTRHSLLATGHGLLGKGHGFFAKGHGLFGKGHSLFAKGHSQNQPARSHFSSITAQKQLFCPLYPAHTDKTAQPLCEKA